MILGQGVLTARPDAKDRVLYSLHFGKVPGVSGGPTNFGLDPYVATRGANGWTTRYVGLPADETPGAKPFGSPLSGSDEDLNAFAFGGTGLCSPCFPDGSTGIPIRMPGGGLVQGMKGSLDPGPGATQAGFIGQRLSDDGTHLVFGSTSKFEEGATAGDVTIYDRDLASGTTHIVSRTPAGATMTGTGNGELAISADGSRILLGKLVSTDPFGVQRWHPYLNVNDSNSTIDLAPTTTTGVIFSGMSADGSTFYFVTKDKLVGGDTDNSADLYRADVSGGSATLTQVSTGSGGGNTDACSPVANFESSTWNNLEGTASCDVLGFAGGAGVSDSGAAYFLSPEKLDGQGTLNQPNLFVSAARAAAALRRHDRGELAGDPQRPDERRRPHLRRPADDARRHGRRLRLEAAADRIPERRSLGGLPLRLRGRRARLRLVRADPGDRDRRHVALRKRAQPQQRRPGVLQLARAARPPRRQRQARRLRVGGGQDRADLDRLRSRRFRSALGQRGRSERLLLHQAGPRSGRRKRHRDEDLRRPRKRRLRDVPATRPMPGVGRVPRCRQSGGAAGVGRHAEGRPRQRDGPERATRTSSRARPSPTHAGQASSGGARRDCSRQGPAPGAAKLRKQAKRLSQAAKEAKSEAEKCLRQSRRGK